MKGLGWLLSGFDSKRLLDRAGLSKNEKFLLEDRWKRKTIRLVKSLNGFYCISSQPDPQCSSRLEWEGWTSWGPLESQILLLKPISKKRGSLPCRGGTAIY
jgi:hypothetical protein